jgi:hypothetical protein
MEENPTPPPAAAETDLAPTLTLLIAQLAALALAATEAPISADPVLRLRALPTLAVVQLGVAASVGLKAGTLFLLLLPATAAAAALDGAGASHAIASLLGVAGWSLLLGADRRFCAAAWALLVVPPALVCLAIDAGEVAPRWCSWTPVFAALRPAETNRPAVAIAAAAGLVWRRYRAVRPTTFSSEAPTA